MELIIGGAYQGKLCYAKARFALKEEEIETCTSERGADFSHRCVRHLEEYALWCVRRGKEPAEELLRQKAAWGDSVLICNDVSCGVVPMDAELRAWREACGRMLGMLSREAAGVTRLFCGLPQRLK